MSSPQASVTFTLQPDTDYEPFDSQDGEHNFTGLYLGELLPSAILAWFGGTLDPIERQVEAIDHLVEALVDLRARKLRRLALYDPAEGAPDPLPEEAVPA